MRVLGLNSGTSFDSIDVGIFDFEDSPKPRGLSKGPAFAADFSYYVKTLYFESVNYNENVKQKIKKAVESTSSTCFRDMCILNFELGEVFAEAALTAIKNSGIPLSTIDCIGSHGQTVHHEVVYSPETKKIKALATLQIGEASVIASKLRIPVVADFRVLDVASGGQGAPLTSVLDYCLFRPSPSINEENSNVIKLRALQNIGGIGNVTLLSSEMENEKKMKQLPLISFDTGPGNCMIDDAMRIGTNGKLCFDEDGKLARSGKVSQELFDEVIVKMPFFASPPPKTTGRELFGYPKVQELYSFAKENLHLPHEDIVRTFTEITAYSIANAYAVHAVPFFEKNFSTNEKTGKTFEMKVSEIIVAGGGQKNVFLMERLQYWAEELLGKGVKVFSLDDMSKFVSAEEGKKTEGWKSEAKEAMLFAFLAYLYEKQRVSNLKQITGAKYDCVLGKKTFPPLSGEDE